MSTEKRPYNLPAHGTRRRYRNTGCRCVACTRGVRGINMPNELRWPYRWFEKAAGMQAEAWFSKEQITAWKANGMGDYEADEACIEIGLMAHDVFPGYLEAGLDCEVYP